MLKPIKFNLMVDGQGLRTLDELKDNFNIHDVMEQYENGTLLRWLEVRGFHEYAEKVKAIAVSASLEEKAKALFGVFDFPSDDENAQQAILALVNSNRREQALKELQVNTAAADKIIENYIAGYKKLKEDMKAHADDAVFIQSAAETLAAQYKAAFELDGVLFYQETKKSAPQIAAALEKAFPDMLEATTVSQQAVPSKSYSSEYTALKEAMKQHSTNMIALKEDVSLIEEKYMHEFVQDYEAFFDEVKDEHPLIVYRLLMHEKTRKYLLDNTAIRNKLYVFQYIHDNIPPLLRQFCFQVYQKGSPGGKWITLSTNKIMLLSSEHCTVRDFYGSGIPDIDIEGKFLLLDRLQYASHSKNGQVIYMEV